MKTAKIITVITAALGAAAVVVPLAVYNLVETGENHMHGMAMKMACEAACVAATIIGAVVTLIAVSTLFVKSVKLNVTASAALSVVGIALIVAPRLIGFCEMHGMACRYITEPTLLILGGAIVVLSLVRLRQSVAALKAAAVSR